LFDVSSTAAALDANRIAGDAAGMAIHADLGSGTIYGSRVVSAADNNTSVAITLNAAAVAALNAAIGSTISFGGAITTLTGPAQQSIFGFTTGAAGTVQLVLRTAPIDWYAITLPGTANALRLQTSTPGDGPGEPINSLDPRIELYDNTGTTLLASGVAMPDGRNESIVVTGLTPGATYKVRVSGEGGSAGEYFLSRNFNFSPVVTALSAAPINENDFATLTGTFSDLDATDIHTVLITWGSGEGSTTLSLAAGVLSFSAMHQYLDDNPSGTPSDVYSIGVTVTDNHFGLGSGHVDLTVKNVAPDVEPVSGPHSGVRGQALNFSGSFTDVGTQDTHQVRWDFGDGTVIDFHSTSDPNALKAPAHIYTDSGVYTLTLSVRDDDSGVTSVSQTVTVTAVALQVDPFDPGKTALVVGGTTDNDTIVLSPQGNVGDINVSINGVSQGVFHPTGHLIVFGQNGDDDIQVAGSIALDAVLYGDAGNDRLKGGAGSGILLGGDGDDMLIGGSGRNILIGGDGKDRLVGGSGDDILIGGFTSFDTNIVFLSTLMDLWNAPSDGYSIRVGKIRLLLDGTTISDDGDMERLTGSSGLDWFFASAGDVITDLKGTESVG
jgi:PKD repeat protein